MKYGLSLQTIEKLQNVFSKHPQVTKVVLYGSRAVGNFRNGSDIDLTMFGDDLDLKILYKIEDEIDDLLLPYKIDISIFSHISNDDLVEQINKVGVIFFEK